MFHNVKLTNFRSYKNFKLELNNGTNIILGPNGSGKTNLLEALFVLATTKSFRASDDELVHTGATNYLLEAEYGKLKLEVAYNQDQPAARRKQIQINHDQTPTGDYISQVFVTLFEPEMLAIVSGSPAERRQFLNHILSNIDRQYFDSLVRYRRVLKQRNSLLKSIRHHDKSDQVFVWDFKLAELAGYLVEKRVELARYLNQSVNEVYRQISDEQLAVDIKYEAETEDYTAGLLERLKDRLEGDLERGYTTLGPHREDLEITTNQQPLAATASRGEVRSLVLALKWLEQGFIHDQTGVSPTLLLDDVFSELDGNRQQQLLGLFSDQQIVITTTSLKQIDSVDKKLVNLVELE